MTSPTFFLSLICALGAVLSAALPSASAKTEAWILIPHLTADGQKIEGWAKIDTATYSPGDTGDLTEVAYDWAVALRESMNGPALTRAAPYGDDYESIPRVQLYFTTSTGNLYAPWLGIKAFETGEIDQITGEHIKRFLPRLTTLVGAELRHGSNIVPLQFSELSQVFYNTNTIGGDYIYAGMVLKRSDGTYIRVYEPLYYVPSLSSENYPAVGAESLSPGATPICAASRNKGSYFLDAAGQLWNHRTLAGGSVRYYSNNPALYDPTDFTYVVKAYTLDGGSSSSYFPTNMGHYTYHGYESGVRIQQDRQTYGRFLTATVDSQGTVAMALQENGEVYVWGDFKVAEGNRSNDYWQGKLTTFPFTNLSGKGGDETTNPIRTYFPTLVSELSDKGIVAIYVMNMGGDHAMGNGVAVADGLQHSVGGTYLFALDAQGKLYEAHLEADDGIIEYGNVFGSGISSKQGTFKHLTTFQPVGTATPGSYTYSAVDYFDTTALTGKTVADIFPENNLIVTNDGGMYYAGPIFDPAIYAIYSERYPPATKKFLPVDMTALAGKHILKWSHGAAIVEIPEPKPVALASQTTSLQIVAGNPATMNLRVTGDAPSYQWYIGAAGDKSAPIAGATEYQHTTAALAVGTYSFWCEASNTTNGTVNTVQSATIPVTVAAAWSQFAALSVRGQAGAGDQTMIVGLVFAGVGSKEALLRVSGPSIGGGVTGYMPNPSLILNRYIGSWEVVADNTDWLGDSALVATFARLGAGAWAKPDSKDAALYRVFDGSVYTAQVASEDGQTGVVLAELYDGDLGDHTRRLTAVSVRNQVGTGENILIAGFVIVGNTPKKVIVSGMGPKLAKDVATYLRDPKLTLTRYNPATKTFEQVGENDDWDSTAEAKAAMLAIGMGVPEDGSKDSALILTLSPGIYTASVSGVGETTGVALCEVYEVP